MTLETLLRQFGVAAMARLNDHGLVQIGIFKTYADADRFVTEVKGVPDCRIPSYGPIHPPRETKPEFLFLNGRADEEANFDVSVIVGEKDPIFRALPEVHAHR